MITTVDRSKSVHIAPMGAQVEGDFQQIVLRPYQASETCRNLRETSEGVFHVTDDVWSLARAAVGRFDELPELLPAPDIRGWILANACRWYAFSVIEANWSEDPALLACQIVQSGRLRDFFGLNRAKHAVVEAAILATRLERLEPDDVLDAFKRLAPLVGKTGGPSERQAFAFLEAYVDELLGGRRIADE